MACIYHLHQTNLFVHQSLTCEKFNKYHSVLCTQYLHSSNKTAAPCRNGPLLHKYSKPGTQIRVFRYILQSVISTSEWLGKVRAIPHGLPACNRHPGAKVITRSLLHVVSASLFNIFQNYVNANESESEIHILELKQTLSDTFSKPTTILKQNF